MIVLLFICLGLALFPPTYRKECSEVFTRIALAPRPAFFNRVHHKSKDWEPKMHLDVHGKSYSQPISKVLKHFVAENQRMLVLGKHDPFYGSDAVALFRQAGYAAYGLTRLRPDDLWTAIGEYEFFPFGDETFSMVYDAFLEWEESRMVGKPELWEVFCYVLANEVKSALMPGGYYIGTVREGDQVMEKALINTGFIKLLLKVNMQSVWVKWPENRGGKPGKGASFTGLSVLARAS